MRRVSRPSEPKSDSKDPSYQAVEGAAAEQPCGAAL